MIVLAAIALLIQAVGPTQVEQAGREAPVMRESFNRQMFDYPTARFRDVHVTVNLEVAEPRGVYLCGFVNGKNRMGAYTGWQPFMASGSSEDMVHIRTQSGDSVADMIIDMTCGDQGNHASDPIDRSAWLTFR